jgi:hypothetical protein
MKKNKHFYIVLFIFILIFQGFIVESVFAQKSGFVPCSLSFNDVNTPWNETDSCEVRHLIIMTKIIIDFIFWQLTPIAILIMAIISGIIFYTSFGNVSILARVKSIWKSVGKGLLIMFFAWIFITIIMSAMGYTGIYGLWWKISI